MKNNKHWIKKDFIEELADLEHKQWQHWTKYFLRYHHCENYRRRWKKQCQTDYKDLSETEKKSDMVWAEKVVKLINGKIKRLETMWKSLDNMAKATNKMIIEKMFSPAHVENVILYMPFEFRKEDRYSFKQVCEVLDMFREEVNDTIQKEVKKDVR
ncbi:MAG: hypothetical protein AABY22_23530 [Nanoarchaeota archaeon]